jgi:hypothetical protein
MCKILGYGEDALTLWALKNHMSKILERFEDKSDPSKCLVFYRPSFGRSGGRKRTEFGEFDAIIVSRENIYLVESKWDNLSKFKNDKNIIRPVQELRHQIFSWYLTHWSKKYCGDWKSFIEEQGYSFKQKFKMKKENVVSSQSLLSRNLESILNKSLDHCRRFSGENSIKNVLLFFYNDGKKPKLPDKIAIFNLVKIDYSKELKENFITLS